MCVVKKVNCCFPIKISNARFILVVLVEFYNSVQIDQKIMNKVVKQKNGVESVTMATTTTTANHTAKARGVSKQLVLDALMKHPSKECGTNTCVHNALIILHPCGVHALHSTGMGLNIFETSKPFHIIFVTISLCGSSMLSLLIRTTYTYSRVCISLLCSTLTQPTFGLCMPCHTRRVEWNGYELAFCCYCRCLYFTYHKWTNRDTKFLCRTRRR